MLRRLSVYIFLALALGGSYLFADLPEEQTDMTSQTSDETWSKKNFTDDSAQVKRFVDKLLGETTGRPARARDKSTNSAASNGAR